jgi:hypothetical protein
MKNEEYQEDGWNRQDRKCGRSSGTPAINKTVRKMSKSKFNKMAIFKKTTATSIKSQIGDNKAI